MALQESQVLKCKNLHTIVTFSVAIIIMYHVSHILVKNPLGKDFPDFLIPIMISPSKGFNFFLSINFSMQFIMN